MKKKLLVLLSGALLQNFTMVSMEMHEIGKGDKSVARRSDLGPNPDDFAALKKITSEDIQSMTRNIDEDAEVYNALLKNGSTAEAVLYLSYARKDEIECTLRNDAWKNGVGRGAHIGFGGLALDTCYFSLFKSYYEASLSKK